MHVTDTIEKQIQIERFKNIKQLGYARIGLVVSFFLLHLYMGFVLNEHDFRGKEIHFAIYLTTASLLLAIGKNKLIQSFNPLSIAILDIPLATLILRSWAHEQSETGMLLTGGLALSFNLFFIHLSSFLLSFSKTIVTFIAAAISVGYIQVTTQTHLHTIIVSQLLLFVFLFTTLYKNKKIYLLIKNSYLEQARVDKLARYFSPNVASHIQSQSELNPEGREAEVTVLFADIRDFTSISESISGQEVVQLLNALHERLVECIFSCGGTLDKYIGDGIMAYFGAPITDPNHADKGVECANRMRKAIFEFNQLRTAQGKPPISVGIGLHSGKVVIGDVGASIRREYTIIGDTVNTASRVEALTKKHQLDFLATDAVREGMKDKSKLRLVGEDDIRGKTKTIRTYTI